MAWGWARKGRQKLQDVLDLARKKILAKIKKVKAEDGADVASPFVGLHGRRALVGGEQLTAAQASRACCFEDRNADGGLRLSSAVVGEPGVSCSGW